MRKRVPLDPLAQFPDNIWIRLSELTGEKITFIRHNLKIYLVALEAVGYRLVKVEEAKTAAPVDWAEVSEIVGTVLGDVATDRDMGLMVTYTSEVDLVVKAIREALDRD